MTITLNANLCGIILSLLLELLTLLQNGAVIPKEYEAPVMVVIAFIPKVISVLAHFSTPDGKSVSRLESDLAAAQLERAIGKHCPPLP